MTNPNNFNAVITDGLYLFKCVNNSTTSLTLSADTFVEVRMVFGAESDERFNWTRFNLLPSPPDAPTLVFPLNNSVINASTPIENSWEPIDGADGYRYQSYNVDGAGVCNLNSVRFTATYTEPNTNNRTIADGLTFCWRVKALDGALESEWSNLWKVTIDNTAPVATIVNPTDGAELSGLVTLRGEVEDANPKNSFFRIEGPDGYLETDLYTDGREVHEFDWDTEVVENGEYDIYFEVRDAAGNKLGSIDELDVSVAMVTVTVNNQDAGPEEPVDPTDKRQCMQNGWEAFGFKNQGQCVRFVNTGKDSR